MCMCYTFIFPMFMCLYIYLQGEKPSVQPLTPVTDKSTVHVHNICEVCGGRVFVTLHEWQGKAAGPLLFSSSLVIGNGNSAMI